MKLYLSSYLLPDVESFSKFVGKALESIKMGLVLNSKDGKSPSERLNHRKRLTEYFSKFGMQVHEINLLDHPAGKDLLSTFKKFDVLWFVGGNTFCLRWAMRMSDCESILPKVLEEGMVYAGDSAGAIVAGPTLKYFDNADDPKLAQEAIYEGLGFIDFSILPHWNSEKYSELLKDTKLKLGNAGYKTKELVDGDYLLIEDGVIINK